MSTLIQRPALWLAGAMALGLALGGGVARAQPTPAMGSLLTANEWPDPNFLIEDTSAPIPAMNDAMTGPLPPIAVEGYTTGARDVTVRVASTEGLDVGQYVAFSAPCDPALRATILRVKAIDPGRAFAVTLEYPSGLPRASAACEARVVQHGDASGHVGGGDITSNVHRYADGRVFPRFWLSSRPAHTRLLDGGAHVLIVQKVTDGPEFVFWNATSPSLMAGARRGFGAAAIVVSGAGAAARAYINDGAIHEGAEAATGAARAWITVHDAAPSSVSVYQEGVKLSGPAGSTFVLGEFESVPSDADLPDHSFTTPPRQMVMALASISPWIGASFTLPKSGFVVDMGQASNGVISGGVTDMIGNLEGQCATAPAVLSVQSSPAPTVYGPALQQTLDATGHAGDSAYYAFGAGYWPLRDNHLIMFGTAGTTWRFVSWDLQGFLLDAGP